MSVNIGMGDGYDSESDSTDTVTRRLPTTDFLSLPGRSSLSSTATSTPVPSRSVSPLPQFFSTNVSSSSCTSETDSEPSSPLIRSRNPSSSWRHGRRQWWNVAASSRTRRRRDGRSVRFIKKWARRIVQHPFFPRQPIMIVLTLLLFSLFAVFLTLLLIHILNPDKEPLPWRAYCSVPFPTHPPNHPLSPKLSADPSSSHSLPTLSTSGHVLPHFPPSNLDDLPPAGLFVGVFSTDSSFERRMLVRSTWASHPRSREGAGEGDGGVGTSRTVVRFILGQPRGDWERRIRLEMEMYNDIVLLPIPENMNGGKSHTFFSWSSINAWVPPVYMKTEEAPPQFSYTNYTALPPSLAPHDPAQAWRDQNQNRPKLWVRPDYVVKVDDDSFVMLAELEARLRVELHAKSHSAESSVTYSTFPSRDELAHQNATSVPSDPLHPDQHQQHPRTTEWPNTSEDPLVYWGYLVKDKFMAGELYALSWSLADWVAKDPVVKTMTRGAEDKQTAKWMMLHPRASEVRWTSERCYIYDHPRSGTVYSHGFLFPSEVERVKRSIASSINKTPQEILSNPTGSVIGETSTPPIDWTRSSVSTFGARYSPPLPDLSVPHSIEALVEGSEMSTITPGSPMTPQYAWSNREGRAKQYREQRLGGTIVVHYIKKHFWFLETALALLEGEDFSESETLQKRASSTAFSTSLVRRSTRAWKRAAATHRNL